jgi:hypothetical protein
MKTIFTEAFPPALKDYYDSKIAELTLNTSNTATGTDEVTINGNSGVIVFTGTIAALDIAVFRISNSIITSTDKYVSLSINYNIETALGMPQLVAYEIQVGEILVMVKNISDSDVTNSDIVISFQILNP